MRRPIRIQLLLATVAIVVSAVALASAAGTALAIASAGRSKAEELARIQRTLAEASFPLTENVLRQMAGLSGAEFVLLDDQGRPVHSTVRLEESDIAALRGAPTARSLETLPEAVAVRLTGGSYFARLVPAGRPNPSSPGRLLAVLYGKDRWWSAARRVAAPIIGAGLIAVALAVALATALAGRLVRPIEALRSQTERIASGTFRPLEIPRRDDELADLAASINRMADRLSRYEDEVRRNERLRTLDRLGAGMAHTLRNAATGARLAIEIHQRKHPELAESGALQTALGQLERIESYVRRFLHADPSGLDRAATANLNQVVLEAVRFVRPAFDHGRIVLEAEVPAQEIFVSGDGDSLREMVLNLLVNALEAVGSGSPEGAHVEVDLQRTGPGQAVLAVSDSGPGPDPDIGARLFEPFVSAKPDGTGLGLYLARQTAEAHGGSIRWERPAETTRFFVNLPTVSEVLGRCQSDGKDP